VKSDQALAAEQAMETRISESGLDQVRRVGPTSDTAPDTGTPVETVQADEQPRDEAGRFASPEQPEDLSDEIAADVAERENYEEQAAEPQATDVQDPAVAAFLKKYGGDVSKALAGAVHLQRKAGEQSNEVGELRRMVDELSQLREGIQQQNQTQQQPVMDQATVDWFDQQAIENPYAMAEYARQQGNAILMQRALSTWKEIDPYQAAVYTNELRLQEQQKQFQEQISRAQQLPLDASINVALTNVRSRNPEYANYDDAIATAMEKYPSAAKAVQVAAEGGNTGELEAAIETLYGLAVGDTLRQIALTGPAPDSTTTTNTVAAPTVSEPHGEESATPTPTEQMKAAMKEEIASRTRGVFVAE